MDLDAAYASMVAAARERGRVLVAFSGGVDSGLVAKLAHEALDGNALAVISDAESLSRRELAEARVEAQEIGIPLRVAFVSELANEDYRKNPTNRCYFCRTELAGVLGGIAAKEGFSTIADGVNLSDLGDVRPGIRAMDEAGFWHPLVEFGLAKSDVRSLAKHIGLSFWDKPSNACLSSRVPHGTPITVEVLRSVEAAEDLVRMRGFRQVRVRHLGTTAKVEVPPADVPRLEAQKYDVAVALRALGYEEVVVDPVGYHALG
jgi:uncharacterized protein